MSTRESMIPGFPRRLAGALAQDHGGSAQMNAADLWDLKVSEGMSADEATAHVSKVHGPPPTATTPTGRLKGSSSVADAAMNTPGFLRQTEQLLTLGLADEFRAGAAALGKKLRGGDFADAYGEAKEADAERREEYTSEHPGRALAATLVGGAATSAIAAPLFGAASPMASVPSQALRMAKEGAAMGAVYGAGEAEGGVTNRLKGGVAGAVAGGVTGAVLPAVAGLSRGGRNLYSGLPVEARSAARTVAGGTGGAVVGGVADDEDPMRGAAAGAVLGATAANAPALTRRLRGMNRVGAVGDPNQIRRVVENDAGIIGAADELSDPAKIAAEVRTGQRMGRLRGPQARAHEMLLRAADRAGGLEDVAKKADAAVAPDALVDLAQPFQRLARGAHSVPSRGSEVLENALQERVAGQEDRVLNLAMETTGLGQRFNIADSIDEIANARATEATELYGAIRNAVVDDKRVVDALRQPAFRRAYERAAKIRENEIAAALLEGKSGPELPSPLPMLEDLQEGRDALTLGTLDQVKRGLDDVIFSDKRQGLGKAETGSLEGVRNAFVEVLDKAVPEYAGARSAYAGHSAMIEAMEQGQTLFKMTPEEAERALSRMGQSEREAFRKGALEALAGRVEDVTSGADVAARKPLADRTRDWRRLRLLFEPDEAGEEGFQRFRDGVQRLHQHAVSRNEVARGSQTSRIDADREDIAADVVDMTAGVGPGTVSRLLGKAVNSGLVRGLQGYNEATSDALAPLLLRGMNDPEELRSLIQQLQQYEAELNRRGIVGASVNRGVAGLVGRLTGGGNR
jgi:hypothetical protein